MSWPEAGAGEGKMSGNIRRQEAVSGRTSRRRLLRSAVTGTAGATVRFPAAPSAYNRIAQESAPGEFESVATTSLAEILARDAPGGIDLLKLDCEGAEYEILGAASREDLMRVREIRMEYHNGKAGELRMLLQGAGFAITREHADSAANGTLWAARA
jgi:FkbM family methyltransferase